MSREISRTRRPFKVWDSCRATRKALVVSTLEELIVRGREKLGIGGHETVRVVLETDGSQIDDSEYFRSLPDNTVFLLLRQADRWCPAGVDVIRAALSSIPRIVCEAISSLELQDEVPSWKIMESRGRITIVLTWDQRPGAYIPCGTPPPPEPRSGAHPPDLKTTHRHESFVRRISPSSPSPQSCQSTIAAGQLSPQSPLQSFGLRGGVYGEPSRSSIRTMLSKDGKYETVINDYGSQHQTPKITVISHEEPPYDSVPRGRSTLPPPLPPHGHPYSPHGHPYTYTQRGLPRQGSSSLESGSGGVTAPVHVHTMECSQRGQVPQHPPHGTSGGRTAGSPPEPSFCDFHCCALHEEGRKIQVHKTVATSPIQDSMLDGGRGTSKALHVRFMGVGDDKNGRFITGSSKVVPSSLLSVPLSVNPLVGGSSMISTEDVGATTESSESETENNNSILEEEKVTTQKILLLIDQLSLDQKRHLTIKDIGVILERLSSKIVDVQRLDRAEEAEDCYNWTIKATIKGEVLRELGVIYNGNFYGISEHPNYTTSETSGSIQQLSSTSAPILISGGNPTTQTVRRVFDDDEDMRL